MWLYSISPWLVPLEPSENATVPNLLLGVTIVKPWLASSLELPIINSLLFACASEVVVVAINTFPSSLMRSLSLPAVPSFMNSLEFVVSTVIYSFDPCFNLNAPATLSLTAISTLLLISTLVVDE